LPPKPPVKGLRIDEGLSFEFKPSIGLSAKRIDKLGLDIRSFREPLKRSIQQVLAPSFKKNFRAGGRPDRWEPLAEETVKFRRYYGFNAGPPLVRSGRLMKTIQQFNIWSINETQAAITNLPEKIWYGKVQQAGLVKGGKSAAAGNIPPRPFVLIQGEDYDAIEKVFENWFIERMERSQAYKRSRGLA
jgi:phage gpG-like protein